MKSAAFQKKTEGTLDLLKLHLTRHTLSLSENRLISHVVFSNGIRPGASSQQAAVAEIVASLLGRIQKLVEQGIQDGEIRKDVHPSTVSIMFLGLILSAAVLRNATENGFDMIAHAEKAWPVFVRAIEAGK